MRSFLFAFLLFGCSSAASQEEPCADLDGQKLVYDLVRIEASTPECRKAMAAVDLSSGAFELEVARVGTEWQVTTAGAVYPAKMDAACSLSWNTTTKSLQAIGKLDRHASTVQYVATSCEATLEGTR